MTFKKDMIPWNKGKKQKEIQGAKIYDYICTSCGQMFQTKRKDQIHCNIKCYSKSEKLKIQSKNSELIKGNSKNKYHLGHLKDDVKYGALHDWVRYHKVKTGKCAICGTTKSGSKDGRDLDLANISGKYKRDLDDFEWLCIKCHRQFDKIKKNVFYEVIAVEVKSNGILSKLEKEKCRWYLNNKTFSKIWIAEKTKVKNRIVIEYHDFAEKYG